LKRTRVQELRFPPWTVDTAGAILQVEAVEFTDLDPLAGELELDLRAPVLELSGRWARASVRLIATTSAELCERVLPAGERDTAPLEVVVTLRCEATRLRRSLGSVAWTEAGSFTYRVELDRRELAGSVELHVQVIRSRDAVVPVAGYAARAGAVVASGRGCTILVDEPRAGTGRYLELQYKSFTGDPTIAGSQRGALYRLELEREDPILYLNAEHAALRPILDGKGTRGRRVRLRELLYERIEAGAWTQLLVHVASRLAEDGELSYPWQEAVLDRWLPRLYPALASDAERRERLVADFATLDRLLADIDAALQVHGGLAGEAIRFVEELG
jgi:hypothetical protein